MNEEFTLLNKLITSLGYNIDEIEDIFDYEEFCEHITKVQSRNIKAFLITLNKLCITYTTLVEIKKLMNNSYLSKEKIINLINETIKEIKEK